MKKILNLLLLILMGITLFILVSCSKEHYHTWGEGVITKSPTSSEYGEMTYKCKECDEIMKKIIDKLPHEHTYNDEWSKNELFHWHGCEKENCTVVSDKKNHTLDEGKILVEASHSVVGKKLRTCTVCGYETIDAYAAYPIVNKDEWENALSGDIFKNVSYTYAYKLIDSDTQTDVSVKIANGQVKCIIDGNEQIYEDSILCEYGSDSIYSKLSLLKNSFESFSYDEKSKVYASLIEGTRYTLQFSNGRITFASIIEENSVTIYTLSSYGRTEL